MRGLSASIVGELLITVLYPSGVQASGSQSWVDEPFVDLVRPGSMF